MGLTLILNLVTLDATKHGVALSVLNTPGVLNITFHADDFDEKYFVPDSALLVHQVNECKHNFDTIPDAFWSIMNEHYKK